MITHTLKDLIKGKAELNCVLSGGIAVYHITVADGTKYSIDIDLSDKRDVGDNATFMANEKAIHLMRWIRRAIEKDEIYKIK